jgi:hypothetical protein
MTTHSTDGLDGRRRSFNPRDLGSTPRGRTTVVPGTTTAGSPQGANRSVGQVVRSGRATSASMIDNAVEIVSSTAARLSSPRG